jgi:predicted TIM-barrel fold metal-dependent hydrolase
VTEQTPHVAGPLVDHHCHGLVLRDLDRLSFEALMNEGSGAGRWTGTPFDSVLGLAIRRHCAPLLDLEPHADPDEYLARRAALGHEDVGRRMLRAADIEVLLVDTGFVPEPLCAPTDLAALAGVSAHAHEVLRLETVAEGLLARGTAPADLVDAVGERLVDSGAVAAKSVAAYRTGLALPGARPRDEAVARAVAGLVPDDRGRFRIADRTVQAALAWTAIEAGTPLQVHVGYGDSDVDLLRCDPLLLTAFLRATAPYGVPVLLLHNYPFQRHAAYLAQVFDHVFMDVGLAVHNTGALARHLVAETLELVPFRKVLYSSDAFGLAELYLLASALFRRALADVIADLVDRDELSATDARRLADMVLRDNAVRAYGLGQGR